MGRLGNCADCGIPPWRECVCDRGEPDEPEDVCAVAGHEFAPAGGGLLICTRCEAEQWNDGEAVAS
jgi:hypothetical protein